MQRYPFGKFLLSMPDGHRIRDIHQVDTLYDRAFGFITEEISRKMPDGIFIDIGANIGDTAAYISTYCNNTILCVEGSETFLGYLRHNKNIIGDNIRVIEKFIGVEAFEGKNVEYVLANGTGCLRLGDGSGPASKNLLSIDEMLLQCAGLLKPLALVKTDTDGLDGFIVQELLSKTDCPLFFECDTIHGIDGLETPWSDVFRRLNGYGLIIFDNSGLPILTVRGGGESILRDLSGYIQTQFSVSRIRIHYLDVWAFPPNWLDVFDSVRSVLQSDLLRGYML